MSDNAVIESGKDQDLGRRKIAKSQNRSISKSLTFLAIAVGLKPEPGWEHVGISGITRDSREVQEGYLFVAIKGFVADGQRIIADAVARGAAAVVACEDAPCSSVPLLRVH
ncbi:MAG TPA: hypothetical protein ENH11_07590, partial [Candidatus Acetothermia bacterium]|nr:hypothetical protein [Candidatus Acetothermia bacterium]